MTIAFYFDEHMPRSVADGLSQQGLKVLMAVDVEMEGKDDDAEHLLYASEHNLVLVTFDRPFAGRTMSRTDYSGLICLSESLRTDIGGMIRLLADFTSNQTAEEVAGRVFWLK